MGSNSNRRMILTGALVSATAGGGCLGETDDERQQRYLRQAREEQERKMWQRVQGAQQPTAGTTEPQRELGTGAGAGGGGGGGGGGH